MGFGKWKRGALIKCSGGVTPIYFGNFTGEDNANNSKESAFLAYYQR